MWPIVLSLAVNPQSLRIMTQRVPRDYPSCIRLEVPQKLRFVKRCQSGIKALSGLCSLF